LFKQFLRVVFLCAEPLVFDAVHQRESLRAIDGISGQLDELLRIPGKIIQPAAINENAMDAPARELGLILQIGQDIRQLDIAFFQHHRRRGGGFGGGDSRLADGEVGLAPLQAGFGYGWTVLDGRDTFKNQRLVVELDTVGGLVPNAFP